MNPMTDNRRAQTATEPEAAASEAAAAPPDPSQPTQMNTAEALAREAAELKDRLLRTLAEMENLRRRTAREVADSRTYAIASFARDVLAVADNMSRALDGLRSELKGKADGGVKALLDGVELTERELLKALEKNGVRKFEPNGEKFDPNLHQAMYEVNDASVPAGTIAQVVQSGYMIGERMLRPALVAVAKGGPKAAAPSNDNAGTEPSGPDAA
jgi:molecular chaperone GrpE